MSFTKTMDNAIKACDQNSKKRVKWVALSMR